MINKQTDLDLSEDCGCLYLACEDNLDGVDQTDCQCPNCLEAKIEACIGITGEENRTAIQYRKHKTNHNKPAKHSNEENVKNKNTYQSKRPKTNNQIQTYHSHGRWAEVHSHTRDTIQKQPPKRSHHQIKKPLPNSVRSCERFERQHFKLQFEMPEQPDIPEMPELLPEPINVEPVKKDYNQAEMMLFVNRRIHENLLKHQQQKNKEKQRFIQFRLNEVQDHQERKERLAALQAKARMLVDTAPKISKQHKQPWNYTEQNLEIHTTSCCHKIPLKAKTDTKNYNKQQLQKHQFLKSIYKRIKLQSTTQKQTNVNHKPTEHCPYHQHEKPQQQKQRKEINDLIEKNAKKAMQQITEKTNELKEMEKLKYAKLKGLAIEAQKKLSKSKKKGISNRPEFTYDVAQELRLKRQIAEQLRKQQEKEKENQKQKSPLIPQNYIEKPSNLNATGKSSKSGKANKTNKSKEVKKQLKEQKQGETIQRHQDSLDKSKKFYMWNIPNKVDKVDAPFKPKKVNITKQPDSFRKQVEDQIQTNMRKKTEQKIAKIKQEKYQQKIQKKKSEFMKESYKGESIQLGPGLTQASQLRKGLISQTNNKTKF